MLSSIIQNDSIYFSNKQYKKRSQLKLNKNKSLPKIEFNKKLKSNTLVVDNKYFTIFNLKHLKSFIKNYSNDKNKSYDILKRTIDKKDKSICTNSINNTFYKSSFPLIKSKKNITKIIDDNNNTLINDSKSCNNNTKNCNHCNYLYLEYKGEIKKEGFNKITYIEINPKKIISSLKNICKECNIIKRVLFNKIQNQININRRNININDNQNNKNNIYTSRTELYNNYYNIISKENNKQKNKDDNNLNMNNINNFSNNKNIPFVYDKFLLPNKNNEYNYTIHNLFLFDIMNKVFKKMIEFHDNHNKVITEEEIMEEYNNQIDELENFFDNKIKGKEKDMSNKINLPKNDNIINNNNSRNNKLFNGKIKNDFLRKKFFNEEIKNKINNNEKDKDYNNNIINKDTYYNIKQKIINNSNISLKYSFKKFFEQFNNNNTFLNDSSRHLISTYRDKVKNKNYKSKSMSNDLFNKNSEISSPVYKFDFGPKFNIIDFNEVTNEIDKQALKLKNNNDLSNKLNNNEKDLFNFILLDKNNINKLKFNNPVIDKYLKIFVNDNNKKNNERKKKIIDIKTLELIGSKISKKIYIKRVRKNRYIKNKLLNKKLLNTTNKSYNLNYKKENINLINNLFLTENNELYIETNNTNLEEETDYGYTYTFNLEEIKNTNINDILRDNLNLNDSKHKEAINIVDKDKEIPKIKIRNSSQLNTPNLNKDNNNNSLINIQNKKESKRDADSTEVHQIFKKEQNIKKEKKEKLKNKEKEKEIINTNVKSSNSFSPVFKNKNNVNNNKLKNLKSNISFPKKETNNMNNYITKRNRNNKINDLKFNNKIKDKNKDISKYIENNFKEINIEYEKKESENRNRNLNENFKEKEEEKEGLNQRKSIDIFIKSINDEYNIPNNDNDIIQSDRPLTYNNNKYSINDILEKLKENQYNNYNNESFNNSYFREEEKEVNVQESKSEDNEDINTYLKIMHKTFSYFEIKPTTRITLLKPKLKNPFVNLKIIDKEKLKDIVKSIMKEKPIIKKQKKKYGRKSLEQLFIYNKNEEVEEEEEEKEQNNNNYINNKNININEFFKNIPKDKFNKRKNIFNLQLFYKDDKMNESKNEKKEIEEKKLVQKIKKIKEKNFYEYLCEDKEYEHNDFEESKTGRKNWMEKFRDIDFEIKFKLFKDELQRLKKLSDEDFIKDSLLFLNKDKEKYDLKIIKKNSKINRINEYKNFLKETKRKRIDFNNYYKSLIIFKPSCVFNTSKIEK